MATFSGLTINKVGSGYTLQLTSSGLTGATTNAITVTSAPAISRRPLVRQPGPLHPIRCWRRWCSTARISGTAWGSRKRARQT